MWQADRHNLLEEAKCANYVKYVVKERTFSAADSERLCKSWYPAVEKALRKTKRKT